MDTSNFVELIPEIKNFIYTPTKTLKEYINYKTESNCFGYKHITFDSKKIKEYQTNCIKEIAEKYEVNIELIKLIDSKIIIPVHKLSNNIFVNYDIEIQIRFENAEIQNNKLIKLCSNESIKILNNDILKIVEFCNQFANKYTIEQLTKKKSTGLLSSRVEKIIYENYKELDSIKLTDSNYEEFGLSIKNINEYIKKQINKEALYCFNFVLYVQSLSSDEYNKIKSKIEIKLKEEDETFNKRIEPFIQSKINEISLNYDRIIKNIISQNEKQINELKDNSYKASIELLTILEERDKLQQKIQKLEDKIHELENEDNKIYDTDYNFLKDLIRKTSMID